MPFGETVVVSAANPWDGIPMADQQLAAALARRVSVLYVDPPESAVSRVRKKGLRTAVRRSRLERLGPQFARLTPEGLPGLSRPSVASVNARLAVLQVRSALRRLAARPVACLEGNVMVPVMGSLGERVKAYWAQDDVEGMAPLVGGAASAYARANERLSAAADLVIAANPLVAETFRSEAREAFLIPFGCDARHFEQAATAAPAPAIRLEPPYAVFMGYLGERIDVALLERLADDGVRLLLVGSLHPRVDPAKFDALLGRPDVQWVGGQEFSDLPAHLRSAGVGLVPYTHSRFNLGSFPLKTFEYLAAGLPVVATSLPAMEWIASKDIHIADAPEPFSSSVRHLLEKGRDPESDERRRALARRHSWDARADEVLDALGLDALGLRAWVPGRSARYGSDGITPAAPRRQT